MPEYRRAVTIAPLISIRCIMLLCAPIGKKAMSSLTQLEPNIGIVTIGKFSTQTDNLFVEDEAIFKRCKFPLHGTFYLLIFFLAWPARNCASALRAHAVNDKCPIIPST